MEPGHPDLHSYSNFTAQLQLTKMWLTDDDERSFVEAEFVLASACQHRPASRPLLKRLESKEFERPERLRSIKLEHGHAIEDVFYLSSLPRRRWNHGDDVVAMIAGRQLAHEFPLTREFQLDAEMVAVEWNANHYDDDNDNDKQLHVVRLALGPA